MSKDFQLIGNPPPVPYRGMVLTIGNVDLYPEILWARTRALAVEIGSIAGGILAFAILIFAVVIIGAGMSRGAGLW